MTNNLFSDFARCDHLCHKNVDNVTLDLVVPVQINKGLPERLYCILHMDLYWIFQAKKEVIPKVCTINGNNGLCAG